MKKNYICEFVCDLFAKMAYKQNNFIAKKHL